MSDFDEPEIRHPSPDPAPADDLPPPAAGGRFATVVVFVVVLLVLAGAGWLVRSWLRPAPAPPPAAQPASSSSAETPAPLIDAPSAPVPAAEPLDEDADALVRRLVAALSSHPKLVEWLAHDELVRRFTAVVGNVAFGESPSVHVPFLRPAEPFTVEGGTGVATPSAATLRRYDPLVDLFVSLDVEGGVAVLDRLQPLIDEEWRQLGYPGTFRQALERAVDELLRVPMVERVPLQEGVISWRFADPELERLSPAQKQLLRMGPRNVERVQAKLRRFREALRQS